MLKQPKDLPINRLNKMSCPYSGVSVSYLEKDIVLAHDTAGINPWKHHAVFKKTHQTSLEQLLTPVTSPFSKNSHHKPISCLCANSKAEYVAWEVDVYNKQPAQ